MEPFEVFKSFYHENEAVEIQELLSQQGIQCKIEKTRPIADRVIIGHSGDPGFHIKMRAADFTRAHRVIDELVRKNIDSLDPGYYLYSFTDEELWEIINKHEEWSEQDVVIAQKILADRGLDISEKEIATIKTDRIRQLAASEKAGNRGIVAGYFFALFICVAGLFFGLFLLTSKKLLPDGSKVLAYDKNTRNHGIIIIGLSVTMITISLFGARSLFWTLGWFI